MAQKCHGNFNLLTAISTCSRQFQLAHGNFDLLTAISTCSRQFQLAHGNFNLFTAISTCSRQFQFAHGNFNLFTAISICSRQFQLVHGNFNFPTQFQFFHSNAHGIFRLAHHLSTSAADSGHQKSKRKIESRYLKSIFKMKSENQKLKVHSRTLMPVDSE